MLITSSWKIDLVLYFALVLFLFYKYLTRNFDHWKKRGVFYFKPFPIFGNFYDTFTLKKNIAETLKALYARTDEPYFGIFVFDTPVLIVKSPELIKTVLIKDFVSFNDRSFASPDHNPIFSNFLLFQSYKKWKDTRAKIRQIFTSAKLKTMFPTILEVIGQLNDHIKDNLETDSCKELCTRFSSEIVSRCFFGVDGKCFEPGESNFLRTSRTLFNPTLKSAFVQLMYQFKPEIVDIFKLDFIGENEQKYLIKVLNECIESRKNCANKAKDYIDIVVKEMAENGQSTEEDLTAAMANSVESFIAGNDTISTELTFTLYNLALEPRIQNKLREECEDVLEKYGGITFESLQELRYAEMCVNETARKYVTLQFLDRRTVKDYELPDGFVIEKGTVIYIPSYALHMDEKYFPEPEKYIPERFLDEKINENGIYYMPFGNGPRMCIAALFSKIVLKAVLAQIVTKFEIQICENTPRSVRFDPRSFSMQSSDKLPIRFKMIEK